MGNTISSVKNASSNQELHFIQEVVPKPIQQRVSSCTGKVLEGDRALGCGILIGIDRLLIPLHIIYRCCPENLKVQFWVEYDHCSFSCVFKVLDFPFVDTTLDFAILQLSRNAEGFPGNRIAMPPLSCKEYEGSFLFTSFTQEKPSLTFSRGNACGSEYFCSQVETVPGCSGGGYFDEEGCLFALHLSKSTGLCGYSSVTRRALYLKDILWGNVAIQQLQCFPCHPICPPQGIVSCAPNDYFYKNPCFTEEGRPAIHNQIRDYRYWEWRPRNDQGKGPRGLTISIPNTEGKVTYKFLQNPHEYKKYNKKQEELYFRAAERFIHDYESKRQTPNSFTFQAYGLEFTANLQ